MIVKFGWILLRSAFDKITGNSRVVSAGGDGTFADCCNGLLLRAAKEAGIDVDNPNMKLAQTSTRIGILPTGLYFGFKEEILHISL